MFHTKPGLPILHKSKEIDHAKRSQNKATHLHFTLRQTNKYLPIYLKGPSFLQLTFIKFSLPLPVNSLLQLTNKSICSFPIGKKSSQQKPITSLSDQLTLPSHSGINVLFHYICLTTSRTVEITQEASLLLIGRLHTWMAQQTFLLSMQAQQPLKTMLQRIRFKGNKGYELSVYQYHYICSDNHRNSTLNKKGKGNFTIYKLTET